MKYIHECSGGDVTKKILEVGAGTGRYSVALAREGYKVDALEYTQHNLEIMNSQIDGLTTIRTHQGTALDLSRFADESFDLTLVLGPMYHLYTREDKEKALQEAIRVTKKGGCILIAYCMNASFEEIERIKIVAADGATNYMRECIVEMDEETFEVWMKYHFATCERMDLIGATNHSLDILKRVC